MGNTRAWPVLRTTDLDEALELARNLLSVASWYNPTGCCLSAWARDGNTLRRFAETFPGARTSPYGRNGAEFPVDVMLDVTGVEEAAEALPSRAAITRGHLLWHDLKWPAVPELGLIEEYRYAELEIACHSHDIYCDEWAPEHTVFVHARQGHDARAEWPAAQAGTGIVGPCEFGW